MTTKEFGLIFDILYDNLASKGAPGLDNYEKSVFLSKAQLEIVKNKYNPLGNKYQKGFEETEQRRADLDNLIKDTKSTSILESTEKINSSSLMFLLPDDVLYIIFEEGKIASTEDSCIAGTYLSIDPVTHEEYKTMIKNPFKRPDKDNALRIDYSEINGSKVVEIYSAYSLDEYHFRYIKLPPPIILSDLDVEFFGEGLTIQGKNLITDCILGEDIHQDILNRAVELAINSYKEGNLQSTIQLNTRNE